MKEFTVEIDPDKHAQLVQLAEEPRMSVLIDNALAYFFAALKLLAKGYRIAAVPVHSDGLQDLSRSIVILDIG